MHERADTRCIRNISVVVYALVANIIVCEATCSTFTQACNYIHLMSLLTKCIMASMSVGINLYSSAVSPLSNSLEAAFHFLVGIYYCYSVV